MKTFGERVGFGCAGATSAHDGLGLCMRVGLGLLAVLALSGCMQVPSIHPLCPAEDRIFEPGLVGRWDRGDGKGAWVFEEAEDNKYLLRVVSEGGEEELEASLCRVGAEWFLDIYPGRRDLGQFQEFYLPLHAFCHLEITDSALRVRWMSPSWLRGYLKEQPGAIRHERVPPLSELASTTVTLADGGQRKVDPMDAGYHDIVLTAGPEQLKVFAAKHLKTEGAYEDFQEFKRAAIPPGDGSAGTGDTGGEDDGVLRKD